MSAVVAAFVRRDYQLIGGVPLVAPISEELAANIADNVRAYGATLVELPEAAWESSVRTEVLPRQWDVLVDLWSESEGLCDLVLAAKVREGGAGATVEVEGVYVP